jgi:aspartate aminotransferase
MRGRPGEWLIKAMGELQSQSTSNPCSISAGMRPRPALNGPQDFLIERNIAKFKEPPRSGGGGCSTTIARPQLPDARGRLLRLSRRLSGVMGKTTPGGQGQSKPMTAT